MNDFERFIRDAEGELSATKSTLDTYEKERRDFEKRFEDENPRYRQVREKCRQWREEVSFAQRHLDRARRIAASSTAGSPVLPPHPALAKADKPKPMPGMVEPEPEPLSPLVSIKEEVAPRAAQPFPSNAAAVHASFDRANAKRKIRGWRASYPLAPSYKSASRLERQALTTEIVQSGRYDEWLEQGWASVTDSRTSITMDDLYRAAKFCGVDTKAVMAEARKVHLDVSCYGTYGVDFMWLSK